MPLGSLFRHVACVGCRCDNQPEISQDYYSVENMENLLRSIIKCDTLCRRDVVCSVRGILTDATLRFAFVARVFAAFKIAIGAVHVI